MMISRWPCPGGATALTTPVLVPHVDTSSSPPPDLPLTHAKVRRRPVSRSLNHGVSPQESGRPFSLLKPARRAQRAGQDLCGVASPTWSQLLSQSPHIRQCAPLNTDLF